MNTQEWIDKSKKIILAQAQKKPKFQSLEKEIKEIHLELTYACNMKCRMCDIWSKYAREKNLARKEMPAEEIIDYIRESDILKNIQGVVLSGGEPFLKKGIVELISFFLNAYPNMRVGILSNLYNSKLTYEKLKEVQEKFGLDRVWIGTSLDGLEKLHDNTRGVEGTFRNFLKTLQVLRAAFPKLSVTVNFTLTTDNYPDLFNVYQFCKKVNMTMSVQFPIPWEGAEVFTFSKEQIKEIEAHILKMIEEEIKDFEAGKVGEDYLLSKIFYLQGLIDYQNNPRRVFKKCIGGRGFVNFSPEANVYFCAPLKHITIGNLRDNSFDEIWKSKKAKEIRKKIDNQFCDCWLNCVVYPNISEALAANKEKPAKKTFFGLKR